VASGHRPPSGCRPCATAGSALATDRAWSRRRGPVATVPGGLNPAAVPSDVVVGENARPRDGLRRPRGIAAPRDLGTRAEPERGAGGAAWHREGLTTGYLWGPFSVIVIFIETPSLGCRRRLSAWAAHDQHGWLYDAGARYGRVADCDTRAVGTKRRNLALEAHGYDRRGVFGSYHGHHDAVTGRSARASRWGAWRTCSR
jgi:hypothetical protein